jgi:hypothetical protein
MARMVRTLVHVSDLRDDDVVLPTPDLAPMLDVLRPESVVPLRDDHRMDDDKCPDCGEKLRESLRVLGALYFVDRVCDYCGRTFADLEGGV